MSIDYFASHIDYITSFLHLSFNQIKDKLDNSPIYLVEYIGENGQKRFIEAPMQIPQTYMVCSFGKDDICDFISLYAKESDVKNYFSQRTADYDFIKNRLALRICYIEVKELKEQVGNVCLVLY
jgi:hypothetical protein